MTSLNLVQYDSDEDTQRNDKKDLIPKASSTALAKHIQDKNQTKLEAKKEESTTKRKIKYSSLQTSKNLLSQKSDVTEEWKPSVFDFKKKIDDEQIVDKSTSRPKKDKGFAASFLSNLPKPKKELTNMSKTVYISDSFTYEDDNLHDEPSKKVKTQNFTNEGNELDKDSTDVAQPSARPQAVQIQELTEKDKEMISTFDRSRNAGTIHGSEILEISANNLVDPNWQQNTEKRMAGRLFNSGIKIDQPNKLAKEKNQLASVAYETFAHQDEVLSKAKVMREAKIKTSQKYGW